MEEITLLTLYNQLGELWEKFINAPITGETIMWLIVGGMAVTAIILAIRENRKENDGEQCSTFKKLVKEEANLETQLKEHKYLLDTLCATNILSNGTKAKNLIDLDLEIMNATEIRADDRLRFLKEDLIIRWSRFTSVQRTKIQESRRELLKRAEKDSPYPELFVIFHTALDKENAVVSNLSQELSEVRCTMSINQGNLIHGTFRIALVTGIIVMGTLLVTLFK